MRAISARNPATKKIIPHSAYLLTSGTCPNSYKKALTLKKENMAFKKIAMLLISASTQLNVKLRFMFSITLFVLTLLKRLFQSKTGSVLFLL